MAPTNSVEQKIQNKETVTQAELQALRGTLNALPKDKLGTLKADLESYAAAKQAELQANGTETELKALQQIVEDERKKKMSPLEAKGAEIGAAAGAMTDAAVDKAKEIGTTVATEGGKLATETWENAKALGYREFAALQDPNKSTGEKILRGLGIVALMYGAYRAAKWVVGREGDSFLGRAFRFLGVSALSVWAINHFGKNARGATPPNQPNNAPNAPAGSLLSQLPDGKTLIDGTPRTIGMNGRNHTIAFTHKRIVLDGQNYTLTSSGFALDITKAERTGNVLTLEAGAFGQKGSIQATETELTTVLRSLLSTGTYESTTADGKKVTITRS